MKTLILIYTALILMFLHDPTWASTRTPAKTPTCKVTTGDVGTIFGHGSTIHEARSDASNQCFDRRLALFERARGGLPDDGQADTLIDACVNVTCE